MERYKNLYSQYLDLAVQAHNYHLAFIENGGLATGNSFRRCIREMRDLENRLVKSSRLAYREVLETRKEMQRKAREATIAWQKANPRPRGRPKGTKNNVKHNRTNESSP
jgi:hypothetical protein